MIRTAFYILSFICIFLLLASCEQDRDFSPTFPSRAILGSGPYQGQYWPVDGWKSCAPEEVGMDSELLRKMNEDMVLQMRLHIDVHSVIVIRKGYIVAEQYYADDYMNCSISIRMSATHSGSGEIVKEAYSSFWTSHCSIPPERPLITTRASRTFYPSFFRSKPG
jgi:hypothetical protein